jgi:very-short-patch-repair endonuclease
LSDPAATLLFHMRAAGLPEPEQEYYFARPRRFRADYAYPERRILIEVEGGTWKGGRHVTGAGYRRDCEKYNLAALGGYMVLRFTSDMVRSGEALNTIEKALDGGKPRRQHGEQNT